MLAFDMALDIEAQSRFKMERQQETFKEGAEWCRDRVEVLHQAAIADLTKIIRALELSGESRFSNHLSNVILKIRGVRHGGETARSEHGPNEASPSLPK